MTVGKLRPAIIAEVAAVEFEPPSCSSVEGSDGCGRFGEAFEEEFEAVRAECITPEGFCDLHRSNEGEGISASEQRSSASTTRATTRNERNGKGERKQAASEEGFGPIYSVRVDIDLSRFIASLSLL